MAYDGKAGVYFVQYLSISEFRTLPFEYTYDKVPQDVAVDKICAQLSTLWCCLACQAEL